MNQLISSDTPAGVARGNNCAICWRPFGGGLRHVQTLDGVSRSLCDGCLSRIRPIVIGGREHQKVDLNLDLSHLRTAACTTCGHPVEADPADKAPQCVACFLGESRAALEEKK